jgi:hypothetical protein
MAYQLIKEVKANQEFNGHAERCVYTFRVNLPDQMGANWRAEDLVNAHVNELQAQGSLLLELRVYEDKSGTFTTDYMVELVASASPLWWNAIILGVLAVLAIIFVFFTVKQVDDIAQYSPGAATAIGIGAIAIAVLFGIVLLGAGRSSNKEASK